MRYLLVTAAVVCLTTWTRAEEPTKTRTQAVLGITGTFLEDRGGFKLTALDAAGPCANLDRPDGAGKVRVILEVGDVITKIEDKSFGDLSEFQLILNEAYRANKGKVRLRVRDVNTGKEEEFIASPRLTRVADRAIDPPKPGEDTRSFLGKSVMPIRPGIRFGQTNDAGEQVYHGTIQDLILRPIAESKDGWVRIRQGTKSGWFAKEDSVALDRAVDYFNRRIARDPLDVYAHVAKAAALVELGEVSQAVPPLDAAVRLQPREARWLEMRAEAQVRLGDLEAARRDYRKANEVSPARRVEQEKVLRELKNQRENLLEQERVYEARMRTLEDREKASGASGAGETTQEANRMERESLLRIREGLNEKAEDVARKQIRTGQPDDSEMGKAEIDSRGSDGKSSVLDSLSGIDLTLGSAEGLRRHTDDGGKPVITGTWSPDTDRGWFIYEFEKDGKVTRKPGKGNIDSSTKYGKWKIKEADRKSAVLELPESGRRGYSSYSPAVTVEVQILSASALRIAGNPYSGGNVKFDED